MNIVVIGSGPAGLVSAIQLARAGHQVTVIDSLDTKGHKIGECISGSVNSLLHQLHLPEIEEGCHQPVGGSISRWAGSHQFDDYVLDPQGASWRLRRKLFEQQLATFAKDLGVGFKTGIVKKVKKVEPSTVTDCWQLILHHQQDMQCDFIVDGSGRNGVMARQLHIFHDKGPSLVATWGIAEHRGGTVTDRTLIETVEDGWWYGAYLPDNKMVVVFHTTHQLSANLKRCPQLWQQSLEQTELLSSKMDLSAFAGTNLTSVQARSCIAKQCSGDNWAACGDAALSFDPLSSQGIFNALATADMLAKAINASDRTAALNDYQTKLRQIYGIYLNRRDGYYQLGAEYYQNEFWQQQVSPEYSNT